MDFFSAVKGKLIISCQALPDEPLHSPFIMGRMARAAKEGGACAIRAQSVADIEEIRSEAQLPVIGLIKQNYADSPIYITPTMREVEALIGTGCEMIALDMTDRERPQHTHVRDLIARIHEAHRLVLADISTYEEGMTAAELGVDAISTTMSGYTPYSPQIEGPDYTLMEHLAKDAPIPVFAEGRINTPEELVEAMQTGVFGAIVGSAITRPQLIARRFTDAIA
ncbi:N-acetylmannosamine-6-P epimerase [Selenomonas sp. FOBRC6]|uniref:N-acetylmannosamine-6-phosphate 2-epimerase n=1 Tax=Selenomonas sp. FOBRC6 TaxID=936572 RepID=UPI000277EAE4|nr:N-acetylmannosamine-6-phosphate 2-epimerase [Selenomonas sp. FOBRC6]EJO23624.1 N-acetylmannosamine-6-P epimerase [Selenomonas sp. FOBRC6]